MGPLPAAAWSFLPALSAHPGHVSVAVPRPSCTSYSLPPPPLLAPPPPAAVPFATPLHSLFPGGRLHSCGGCLRPPAVSSCPVAPPAAQPHPVPTVITLPSCTAGSALCLLLPLRPRGPTSLRCSPASAARLQIPVLWRLPLALPAVSASPIATLTACLRPVSAVVTLPSSASCSPLSPACSRSPNPWLRPPAVPLLAIFYFHMADSNHAPRPRLLLAAAPSPSTSCLPLQVLPPLLPPTDRP